MESPTRIRAEESRDHSAIHALNFAAFGSSAEADLIDALRATATPLVSLVAEENEAILGHILFSPVSLADEPRGVLMGLAPMAVAPEHQRRGIGTALVQAGLDRCAQLGAAAVVVLGHPEYYPRFGFSPAVEYGIGCEYDVPDEAFLILELRPGVLRELSGRIQYHPAFREL